MIRLSLLIVAAFVGIQCGSEPAVVDVTALAQKGLVVLQDARELEHRGMPNGGVAVRYVLTESYPADLALNAIQANLRGPSWKPLQFDWMNPTIRSSHVEGWNQFGDQTARPPVLVKQWSAQWLDEAGNLVSYELRYEVVDTDQPSLGEASWGDRLFVSAAWLPTEAVTRMREQVGATGSMR